MFSLGEKFYVRVLAFRMAKVVPFNLRNDCYFALANYRPLKLIIFHYQRGRLAICRLSGTPPGVKREAAHGELQKQHLRLCKNAKVILSCRAKKKRYTQVHCGGHYYTAPDFCNSANQRASGSERGTVGEINQLAYPSSPRAAPVTPLQLQCILLALASLGCAGFSLSPSLSVSFEWR